MSNRVLTVFPARPLLRLLLAGAGAAGLLLLAIWLGNRPVADAGTPATIELSGAELEIARGVGRTLPDGMLAVSPVSADGVMVLGRLPAVPAERVGQASWQIHGLDAGQTLSLVWVSREAPAIARSRQLTDAERAAGRLDLLGESAWQGHLVRVGLMITGTFRESVLVGGIAVAGAPDTLWAPLQRGLGDWSRITGWDARSINYNGDVGVPVWLTPVTLSALWVVTALLIFVALSARVDGAETLRAMGLLAIIAWLVLDVRWQWQLTGRLAETRAAYAGVDADLKTISDTDGDIARNIRPVSDRLAGVKPPARLFIIGEEPGGYTAGRIRWHLLPHRVLVLRDMLPPAESVHTGDFLLLLEGQRGIRVDAGEGRLSAHGRELGATLQLEAPGLGTLFRVGEGD